MPAPVHHTLSEPSERTVAGGKQTILKLLPPSREASLQLVQQQYQQVHKEVVDGRDRSILMSREELLYLAGCAARKKKLAANQRLPSMLRRKESSRPSDDSNVKSFEKQAGIHCRC